jgi:hypothetical protein
MYAEASLSMGCEKEKTVIFVSSSQQIKSSLHYMPKDPIKSDDLI